jgi:hypothetical protein
VLGAEVRAELVRAPGRHGVRNRDRVRSIARLAEPIDRVEGRRGLGDGAPTLAQHRGHPRAPIRDRIDDQHVHLALRFDRREELGLHPLLEVRGEVGERDDDLAAVVETQDAAGQAPPAALRSVEPELQLDAFLGLVPDERSRQAESDPTRRHVDDLSVSAAVAVDRDSAAGANARGAPAVIRSLALHHSPPFVAIVHRNALRSSHVSVTSSVRRVRLTRIRRGCRTQVLLCRDGPPRERTMSDTILAATLEELRRDGVLQRFGERYETTRRWRAARHRASLAREAASERNDLRNPIVQALLAYYGESRAPASLGPLISVLFALEAAERAPRSKQTVR